MMKELSESAKYARRLALFSDSADTEGQTLEERWQNSFANMSGSLQADSHRMSAG